MDFDNIVETGAVQSPEDFWMMGYSGAVSGLDYGETASSVRKVLGMLSQWQRDALYRGWLIGEADMKAYERDMHMMGQREWNDRTDWSF